MTENSRNGSGKHVNYHRKLWHFSSGAVVVAALVFFEPSKRWAIGILVAGLALMIAIDLGRYFSRRGKRLFWKHLGFLTSDKEKKGPTTSLFYAASLLVEEHVHPELDAGHAELLGELEHFRVEASDPHGEVHAGLL